MKFEAGVGIDALNNEFLAKDVCKFRAITVAATRGLFLIVIKV